MKPQKHAAEKSAMEFRAKITPKFLSDLDVLKKCGQELEARVRRLMDAVLKSPFEGPGSPHAYTRFEKCWARRITGKHRLVYTVDDGIVKFMSCYGHYDDH
jgi:toxin YoeB